MGSQDKQQNDCQSAVRETFPGRDISESFFGHRKTATRFLSVTRVSTAREAGSYSLLLNFRRNFGEPSVFLYQISIRHSRNVIADRSMESLFVDPFRRSFTQLIWMKNVRFENSSQHLACSPVHLGHARMVINILI